MVRVPEGWKYQIRKEVWIVKTDKTIVNKRLYPEIGILGARTSGSGNTEAHS